MSPEQNFAAEWKKVFQGGTILPRDALDYALIDTTFYAALVSLLPQISVHAHPDYLRAWLKSNENRFIHIGQTTTLRFTRAGHRWRLLEVPFEINAYSQHAQKATAA